MSESVLRKVEGLLKEVAGVRMGKVERGVE